jgi:BirA family biotin operon repressor/biotin-[acetyl-CoA-carboxylase] ligase
MSLWTILTVGEVSSTNAFAKERVQSGVAHHGEVVLAQHQTAGRGRIPGRSWTDVPGESLLMSVILERALANPECIQYLAALSTLSALRHIGEEYAEKETVSFRLKWPNDILLGRGVGTQWSGRKLCGILTEAVWQGSEFKSAIVGIGVNVRQRSFDDALLQRATSFRQSGIEVSVSEVRDRILAIFEADLDRYSAQSATQARNAIIDSLRSELGWMWDASPMKVSVGIAPTMHGMRFEGISDMGALMLRSVEGMLVTLQSGSVESEYGHTTAGVEFKSGEAA